MTVRVQKAFAVKNAALDDNRISGAASVMGSMDRSWWHDVIFPGAYRNCLADFLQHGFVADTHDWCWQSVVAMPLVAEERGNELYTEAEFHQTQGAQDVRQKCRERIARGLAVGLSVGFQVDEDGFAWFPTGQALLDFANAAGHDMTLFDVEGIRAHRDECRGIFAIDVLYEYSIVPAPAHPEALASDAKAGDGLLAEAHRLMAEMTTGRALSDRHRQRINECASQIAAVHDDLMDLYASTTTKVDGASDALTERSIERALRDAGISRKRAVTLAGAMHKAGLLRDAASTATTNDDRQAPGGLDARITAVRQRLVLARLGA
jgi:phage head maturation protease